MAEWLKYTRYISFHKCYIVWSVFGRVKWAHLVILLEKNSVYDVAKYWISFLCMFLIFSHHAPAHDIKFATTCMWIHSTRTQFCKHSSSVFSLHSGIQHRSCGKRWDLAMVVSVSLSCSLIVFQHYSSLCCVLVDWRCYRPSSRVYCIPGSGEYEPKILKLFNDINVYKSVYINLLLRSMTTSLT